MDHFQDKLSLLSELFDQLSAGTNQFELSEVIKLLGKRRKRDFERPFPDFPLQTWYHVGAV